MAENLEKRVEILEKELSDLKMKIGGSISDARSSWLNSFGSAKDDPAYKEMVRLGSEDRKQQREVYDVNEDAGT